MAQHLEPSYHLDPPSRHFSPPPQHFSLPPRHFALPSRALICAFLSAFYKHHSCIMASSSSTSSSKIIEVTVVLPATTQGLGSKDDARIEPSVTVAPTFSIFPPLGVSIPAQPLRTIRSDEAGPLRSTPSNPTRSEGSQTISRCDPHPELLHITLEMISRMPVPLLPPPLPRVATTDLIPEAQTYFSALHYKCTFDDCDMLDLRKKGVFPEGNEFRVPGFHEVAC